MVMSVGALLAVRTRFGAARHPQQRRTRRERGKTLRNCRDWGKCGKKVGEKRRGSRAKRTHRIRYHGRIEVAADHYWGAQTERSLHHFAISHETMPPALMRAFGVLKLASAQVNQALGKLDAEKAAAHRARGPRSHRRHAHGRVPAANLADRLGHPDNMNVNEVISNRAIELAGGVLGSKVPVHPNDDVNMSQSSNDTFPTAMHIAAVMEITERLVPSLRRLRDALDEKAKAYVNVTKIGRTTSWTRCRSPSARSSRVTSPNSTRTSSVSNSCSVASTNSPRVARPWGPDSTRTPSSVSGSPRRSRN